MMMKDRILTTVTCLSAVALFCGCASGRREEAPDREGVSTAHQYSYAYWLNGYRKASGDSSPDILCVEAGRYGLQLDVDDLANPRFGLLTDNVDYEEAVTAGTQRLAGLAPADLSVELEVEGKTYRAVTCRAGDGEGKRDLRAARMWESGQVAQHYDLQELRFMDDAGAPLACYGSLDVVAWPGSLTLTAELTPDFEYADGTSQGVSGNGLCIVDKPLDIPHSAELEPAHLTVECWFNIPETMSPDTYGWLVCKNGNEWGQGNYGFMFRRGVSAVLNNSGGRDNQHRLRQHGALEQGKWHHLALTYDGATMRFYLNGREQGSKKLDETRKPGKGNLRIGKRADGQFAVVGGLYDQVRVWNRALPANEIVQHAKQPAQLTSRDGLVLEKNFDEGRETSPPAWSNAEMRLRFKGAEKEWQAARRIQGTWKMGERQKLSLSCNLDDAHAPGRTVSVKLSTPDGQAFPVVFSPEFNSYVAEVKGLKRSFDGGYTKITDYDEFDMVLVCAEEDPKPVPFLLDLRGPSNITGLVPILCHTNGIPTGVHVQLSKNWHNPPMSPYLRAYAMIPVKPGENRYRLRIPYGFYGSLPSASHAQLCLIGYGGNQRWDQLALACGGEAITFDADMSLTDVAICDVRAPLGRQGKDGNTWGWTDAGWGGDWLGIYGADKKKLTFAGMKVAYLSHGPCLSDVIYSGAYGSDRSVLVDARIQFPRTDDYGRTFQRLKYRFQREMGTAGSYLMRRHAGAADRVVAYGNAEGLIEEKRVTGGINKDDLLIPPTELKGPGPWWVAFPDRDQPPTGYVSLIIRDYACSFGGKTGQNPFLVSRVASVAGDKASLETWIIPPPDVKSYQPGDWVDLDAEWVHLVTEADNYGGANEVYRRHLAKNPRSWTTTYREVKGNDLDVAVDGGTLLQTLPIIVKAKKQQVTVSIQGGVGHVPIRFEGLATADGYAIYEVVNGEEKRLDQSVHGNDYWQVDCDAGSNTYQLSFNLPVDGKPSSNWVLRR